MGDKLISFSIGLVIIFGLIYSVIIAAFSIYFTFSVLNKHDVDIKVELESFGDFNMVFSVAHFSNFGLY